VVAVPDFDARLIVQIRCSGGTDPGLSPSVYQPFLEDHSGLFQDHGPTGTWAADGQIDREASLACGDGPHPATTGSANSGMPVRKGSKRATGLPISGLNAHAAPHGGRDGGAGFVRVASSGRNYSEMWQQMYDTAFITGQCSEW
jgi:hypothetical protein